jgi:hypothetical protein
MVIEKLLVAATLHDLNIKLSSARANILVVLDARQNGQATTSVPFSQLCTMLIQHNSHTSFLCHQPATPSHGLYDPNAFNSAVEAAVEEALAARTDNSSPKRGPHPCRHCSEAGIPMADRFHWHQDCPLPLQPHEQQQQYAAHPSAPRGLGRGPRGRGGHWGRGGRGYSARDTSHAPSSVSHTIMKVPTDELASAD